MKRFAFLVLIALLFVSCSDNADGTPDSKYSVGDIVLTDGSVVKFSKDSQLTAEQKAKAVSIIYSVGDKTLGLGLVRSSKALKWCTKDASAANKSIPSIACKLGGDVNQSGKTEYFFEFSGDLDGSDNLEQISRFLTSNNLTDDTKDETKYPAFYFARNYKTADPKVVGTAFESGWYLPSIAELYPISKNLEKINVSLAKVGGESLTNQWKDWLTSSSQSSSKANGFCALRISDSQCADKGIKYSDDNEVPVCAVRKFE